MDPAPVEPPGWRQHLLGAEGLVEGVVRLRADEPADDRPGTPTLMRRHADDRLYDVAVVAASEVLRRGVEGLLRAVPSTGSIRECAGPEGLVALLARPLDVVIAAAADLAWLEPHWPKLAAANTPVLLVVDESSVDGLANHALAPECGFLWQPSLTSTTLRDALDRCRHGELPMPAGLARALLSRRPRQQSQVNGRTVRLTGREREALALLACGLSNKQIARRLSISSHGAKRLVASIMLKLDAPNRTMAAVTAIRSGITEPEPPERVR